MFRLLYFIGVAVFLFTLFTQIVIPSIRGTKLFPIFRRKSKLQAAIAEAEERKEEVLLEKELVEAELEIKEIAVTIPKIENSNSAPTANSASDGTIKVDNKGVTL